MKCCSYIDYTIIHPATGTHDAMREREKERACPYIYGQTPLSAPENIFLTRLNLISYSHTEEMTIDSVFCNVYLHFFMQNKHFSCT